MTTFEYAPAPESRSIVDIKPSYGLFVDGDFVDGKGKPFKTISPATEEVLAEVAEADQADESSAVIVCAGPADEDTIGGMCPGGDHAVSAPCPAVTTAFVPQAAGFARQGDRHAAAR
jgi:aldehyde dehydrogenase (NAD+)